MKKSNWFAWVKWFFGFGQKPQKKVIVYDIETGGLGSKMTVIHSTEAYKVEHKKHSEAMDALLDKIEKNKIKNIESKANNDFEDKLEELKSTYNKHYRREKVEIKKPVVKRETVIIEPSESFVESVVMGYVTDSTVEGTLLGGDMLGAAIGDMLNTSNDTPISDAPIEFDGGFGNGGFSGGGAGADFSTNSDYTSTSDYDNRTDYSSNSDFSSGSDYSSSSSYDDSPSRQDW
jgi:hypothetical protein